jgi:L-threonylcarbamoyladenylate synthase
MTKILPANSRKSIRAACHLMQEGEVVAFPTDTVYGLGAKAFERFGVRQIFELKKRPNDKGLPVFIAQVDDLNLVARRVPNAIWPLLQQFWPGALTVVLPKVAALPDDVTGGQDTVAVRIPDHPVCFDLLVKMGCPLAVTSANRSGLPTPSTAPGVAAQLGDELPLILDGGRSPGSQPSTIIDLSVSPPRLLRLGPVSLATLREFLPDLVGDEVV